MDVVHGITLLTSVVVFALVTLPLGREGLGTRPD